MSPGCSGSDRLTWWQRSGGAFSSFWKGRMAGWQDGRMAWWLRLWGLVWSTLWIRSISASMMCLGMGYIMFLLQFISIHGRSMGKMTIRIHKISEGMEQGFPIIFGQAHATIPGEEISFEKQVPLLQKVVRIHLPKLSTHMGQKILGKTVDNHGKPPTTQWFVIIFPSKIAIWDCTPFSDTPRFAQSFWQPQSDMQMFAQHRKAKAKAKQASFGALGRGCWGAQQIVQ